MYFTTPHNQRVAVKTVVTISRISAWYKHGAYVQREGTQQEGRGLGFTATENVRMTVALAGWQRSGDAHVFKIVLSPEHGDRLDLQDFTRATLQLMEKDLGRKLEWVAIDHYNTNHPHVHLCLRGVDRDGQRLTLSRDYLNRGIRTRAGEVATVALGWRREPELEQMRERAKERMRLGMHDYTVARKLDKKQQVHASALTTWEQRRLEKLAGVGLAWERKGTWTLAFRWQEKLIMANTHEQEQNKEKERREREEQRLQEQQRRRIIDEQEREQKRERGR